MGFRWSNTARGWALGGLIAAAAQSPAIAASEAAAAPTLAPARTQPHHAGALPSGDSDEFRRRFLSWTAPPAPALETIVSTHRSKSPGRLLVSSPFGWRSDPIRGVRRRHAGVDLPGGHAMPIYATGAGVVSIAGWVGGYGNLVEIEHAGGVRTRYGHPSAISVARGAPVGQGELIGRMGSTGRSTGTHLHYEVRVHGAPVDPLDYIGQTQATYQTAAWLPAPAVKVTPRWTGWERGKQERASLPEARIR